MPLSLDHPSQPSIVEGCIGQSTPTRPAPSASPDGLNGTEHDEVDMRTSPSLPRYGRATRRSVRLSLPPSSSRSDVPGWMRSMPW